MAYKPITDHAIIRATAELRKEAAAVPTEAMVAAGLDPDTYHATLNLIESAARDRLTLPLPQEPHDG